MIFLYSYTIFCAFFLFALDRINNFCFIYKSDTKKILSNYFIFQAITFFIQIIAIYVKISNLSNYISFVSFLSRLLEIISWGYAAFLIDYFWLENRLKLKNKFLCYSVIIILLELFIFLSNSTTKSFCIHLHIAERIVNLSVFLIIISYMLFVLKKRHVYYICLYSWIIISTIFAIILDQPNTYGQKIILFSLGIFLLLLFSKFYIDKIFDFQKKLSKRDREIINGVINNLSNSELANKLNIAESTIKNKLNKLYKILGVNDRQELIAKYKK